MKINLSVCVIVMAAVVLGCGLMKPSLPDVAKVQAALGKVVKKENPDATFEIISSKIDDSQKGMAVEFRFKNFKFTSAGGSTKELASGRGVASYEIKDGKWMLDTIQIMEPETDFITPRVPVE